MSEYSESLDAVLSYFIVNVDRNDGESARAELATLRATVAALTAERDAAYRRGWCDAREEAACASDKFASATRMKLPAPFGGLHDPDQDGFETASPFVKWTAQSISNAIRAMQPPAPTEHDADANYLCKTCGHLQSDHNADGLHLCGHCDCSGFTNTTAHRRGD